MFSEVPRGQIKKVINFAFWVDIHWYGLALYSYMIFDELKCYSSVSFKVCVQYVCIKACVYVCVYIVCINSMS